MNASAFKLLLVILGLGFAILFSIIVLPPLFAAPDIIGALAAGFVNPYASGYALDAIFCWAVLAVWVIYEAKARGVKHGWVALMLGIVPGVATGFAAVSSDPAQLRAPGCISSGTSKMRIRHLSCATMCPYGSRLIAGTGGLLDDRLHVLSLPAAGNRRRPGAGGHRPVCRRAY